MKITLVGDIFPANLPYNRGFGVAASFQNNDVKAIVGDASFAVGNLESPILHDSDFSTNMQFAGHQDFVKMLKKSGFEVLSIANNHVMEHGRRGVESTIEVLRKCDIACVGQSDKDGLSNIVIKDYCGVKMGFIAYNAIDNHQHINHLYSEYECERVKKSIVNTRELGVDYVFVMLHWGDEYIHRPSIQQMQEARSFIDCGANFIIGSHSHVAQPVEEYNGGLICYSLGNFIFDMTVPKDAKIGQILDLELLGEGLFNYSIRYIKLQENYFPAEIDSPKMDSILKFQKKLMADESNYEQIYNREKKRKRNQKRILEKFILIKNWRKYDEGVRKEMMEYYKKKLFH